MQDLANAPGVLDDAEADDGDDVEDDADEAEDAESIALSDGRKTARYAQWGLPQRRSVPAVEPAAKKSSKIRTLDLQTDAQSVELRFS